MEWLCRNLKMKNRKSFEGMQKSPCDALIEVKFSSFGNEMKFKEFEQVEINPFKELKMHSQN